MSAIKQALEHLNSSLQNLENSLSGFEKSLTGTQRDMFGGPPPSNENTCNGVDAAVVAKRLDIAIEKVEEILSEAKEA